MPTPQIRYQDIADQIASREREAEMFDFVQNESDNPFWSGESADRYIMQGVSREVRLAQEESLTELGSKATITIQNNNFALPDNALDIISVVILRTSQDTVWVPAVEVDISSWFQTISLPIEKFARWVILGNTFLFSGYAAQVVVKIEPTLNDFKGDLPILPEGHSEAIITHAHKMLMAEDFLQTGRL